MYVFVYTLYDFSRRRRAYGSGGVAHYETRSADEFP